MIDAMPRPRPPHLCREVKRGKPVWYVRKGRHGPRIRVHGDYGSEDFWSNYRAALETETSTPPRKSRYGANSLGWLVDRYQDSAAFRALAPSTQMMRAAIMRQMVKKSGNVPARDIDRKSIAAARDKRTPNSGNNFLKTARGLFSWAYESDLIPTNPTIGVKKTVVRTEGHHTWTPDEVQRYWQKWHRGTRERLALDLMLFTGLRRGDVVKVGRQHINGGYFTTGKTGTSTRKPVLPALAETISAGPSGNLTLLVTSLGAPFSPAGFGNWFREACIAAGVPGRAHGLRKAGATIASENGATDAELMALFDWTSRDMATLYTRRADRSALAASAAEKMSRGITGTDCPSHLDPVRGKSEKQ